MARTIRPSEGLALAGSDLGPLGYAVILRARAPGAPGTVDAHLAGPRALTAIQSRTVGTVVGLSLARPFLGTVVPRARAPVTPGAVDAHLAGPCVISSIQSRTISTTICRRWVNASSSFRTIVPRAHNGPDVTFHISVI